MGRSHFPSISGFGWSPRLLAFFLAFSCVFGAVSHAVQAEDRGTSITIGESNSDAQRQELLAYFEADENDTIEIVTLEETRASMAGILDPEAAANRISSAYSSTALTCRDLGEGLDITTRNITLVTPSIYAIALVTAGIGDARLVVAAPNDAPAQGTAALTGVFKTWQSNPCASGSTSPERQQLAIRQVSLATEIGTSLYEAGINSGMALAGDILLYTQQTVVTENLTNRGEVQDALAEQEMALGLQLDEKLRKKVVDFMVDLIALDIDWGTYAYGWEITGSDDQSGIAMRGDGIAIRNAQATATAVAEASATAAADATATQVASDAFATAQAEAAAAAQEASEATQTAEAERAAAESARATEEADRASAESQAKQTAEAEALATEEAVAIATRQADVSATEQARLEATSVASAEMTQTANAPTPTSTAIPALAIVGGKIDSVNGSAITISVGEIGTLQTYTVAPGALVLRDGNYAELAGLKAGDFVTLGIDPDLKTVRSVEAKGPSTSIFEDFNQPYMLVLPFLLVLILLLVRRRRSLEEPFVVAHVRTA